MFRVSQGLFSGFAPATEAVAQDWPGERTRVVHNYPKALFGAEPARAAAPDPRRVLYSGGLSRTRGILLALEAVREARRQLPDLRLELVGWVMDAETGRAIQEAEREGWCRHTPRLPAQDLRDRARGAGVGLATLLPLPNYLQALPTKIFEYMAMGIPVLASDFPLWRRLVEESGAGRVAAPEPHAVARALVRMCSDPRGLEGHAAAGHKAYRERYRWEAEAANLRWHLDRAGLPAGAPDDGPNQGWPMTDRNQDRPGDRP